VGGLLDRFGSLTFVKNLGPGRTGLIDCRPHGVLPAQMSYVVLHAVPPKGIGPSLIFASPAIRCMHGNTPPHILMFSISLLHQDENCRNSASVPNQLTLISLCLEPCTKSPR